MAARCLSKWGSGSAARSWEEGPEEEKARVSMPRAWALPLGLGCLSRGHRAAHSRHLVGKESRRKEGEAGASLSQRPGRHPPPGLPLPNPSSGKPTGATSQT